MAAPLEVRERAALRLAEAERELRVAQDAVRVGPDDDASRRRYAAALREYDSATAWAAALINGRPAA